MRKKIALILAMMFVASGLPALPAGGAAKAAATAEKPYFIVDEQFGFVRNKDWPVMPASPSGWEIKAAGGELSAGYNSWFKIADKTELLPVEITKRFRPENEGVFTFEFRVNFSNILEGTVFQLRSEDKAAISFLVKGGNLCYEAGSEAKVLEKITTKKEYGVRADFDLDSKKVTVYVNGELKGQGLSFKDNVSSIDHITIKTGVEAKGEMFLNPIKLYKNYIIQEKFMTAIEGALPGDWEFDKSGGKASTFKLMAHTPPDFYTLKMEDSSSSGAVTATKKFADYSGPLSLEFKNYFVKKFDGVQNAIYNGDALVFGVGTSGGKLCYTDAGGNLIPIDDYIQNLWYAFRVTFDFDAKKATLWVNGRKAAIDVDLPASASSVNNFKITTGKEGTGELWVDDIALGANPPLPADYVPTPKPAQKDSDLLVGIQSCSMWREGHHLGWDYISGWPERQPLIGFYDEGNTEVADWETKFLVENGVDFEVFSWFRTNSGDAAVKEPYGAGYSLHQGYYYSEYSDMLKYMIYWENGGMGPAHGSADFRNNIVPFWIEYYFKDSRYFKVDGKPVLSILTYSGLTRDFGNDPDKIKAELDYLRKACRDAGVGEILLITNTGSADKNTLANLKRVGFDAVYAYNWSVPSKSIQSQKNSLQSQQNQKTISVIPNLNMGFDATAWGVSMGQGGYVPLDEFDDLLTWARDSFMPGEDADSLGRRLVVFANWNEYGEGHYIMPAGLAGFGYLDVIRNVFAPGQDADNILPSEEAKIRMGRLYSVPRFVAPPLTDKPETTGEVVKGWYFDKDGDFEGWEICTYGDPASKRVEDFKVSGGMISGKALDTDPGIQIDNPPALDLDSIPYIRVKSKASFGGPAAQIYFITEADQNWDEGKCLRYTVEAKADEIGETLIYTWDNPNWKGKLKAIRFDPFDRAPGETFAFDSIEFLSAGGSGDIKVYMDGDLKRFDQSPVIINDRTMVPLRAIFEALGVRIDWDGPTRTVTCFKNGKLVEITIGNKTAYIDKKAVELDQPAEIVNDRTLVPIRFVSEAYGARVEWDAEDRSVHVDTKAAAIAEVPSGPNLVSGGDMEGKATGFGSWQAELAISKKEFHEGKQSLEINGLQQWGCVKFPATMQPGVEYYISAWIKAGADIKSGTVARLVGNYVVDGELKQEIALSSEPLSSEKWTFVSGTYTINASGATDTLISVFTDSPAVGGTFYMDDVKVIKMGDASSQPAKTAEPEKTPEPTKAPAASSGSVPASDGPSEAEARKNNVITDPGMEGKAYKHGQWGADITLTKEEAYTGKQSLKAVKTENFGTVKFLNLDIKPNQEYEISTWVKNGPGARATSLRCVLVYTNAAGEKFEKIILSAADLSEDWIQLKGTYTIEEKGKISDVHIHFFSDLPASAGDIFYLDDVIVAPAA